MIDSIIDTNNHMEDSNEQTKKCWRRWIKIGQFACRLIYNNQILFSTCSWMRTKHIKYIKRIKHISICHLWVQQKNMQKSHQMHVLFVCLITFEVKGQTQIDLMAEFAVTLQLLLSWCWYGKIPVSFMLFMNWGK